MSKIILVLSVLWTCFAYSYPELNNYARYTATYAGKKYEMKRMLYAHNKELNTYSQVITIYENEKLLLEQTHELPYSWFYNPKKVQSVLDNCQRREGALGSETIDGNVIPTCTFFNESSQLDYSIGPVPFGQIRHQWRINSGAYLDFYLKSFH